MTKRRDSNVRTADPLLDPDKVLLTDASLEDEYQGYVETYYLNGVEPDEAFAIRHAVNWVKRHSADFASPPLVLEIGNGGTLHHLIPFTKLARGFVIADIRESACQHVRKWTTLNDDGGIWRQFAEFVLAEEFPAESITRSTTDSSMAELRAKICDECIGDLSQPSPLGSNRSFPLVLCYYTSEVAALASLDRWKMVMHNLGSLVQPGGFLLMSCIRDSDFYVVERNGRSYKHAIPKILENDFLDALSRECFDMIESSVEAVRFEGQEEHGLTGILLIAAKKLR